MSFSSALAMPRCTVLRAPVSRRSAVSGSDSRKARSGRSLAMARSTPPITATSRSVPASPALACTWSTSRRRARHQSSSSSNCSRLPARRYSVARATPRRRASDRMSSRCPATNVSTAAAKIPAGIPAGTAAPAGQHRLGVVGANHGGASHGQGWALAMRFSATSASRASSSVR